MKIEIHPNARKAFDEEARRLLSAVQTTPQRSEGSAPAGPASDAKFFPAATLKMTDLRDFTEYGQLPGGVVTWMRRLVGEMFHGFDEEGYRNLRLLAEKMQRLKGVREKVGRKAMEAAVFDWSLDRYLGRSDQELCERVLEEFESRIRERWVWVAIFGLNSDFDFDLGRTQVHPFRAAFFETWETSLRRRDRLDGASQAHINEVRRKLQGSVACTMKIEAEPIRAREIALEEAESACAILRVFLPSILHPLVPSYCRPMVREELEFDACLTVEGDEVAEYSESDRGSWTTWNLDGGMMDLMQTTGLGSLHHLYIQKTRSEFENDLLRSIFTYSRSSLQKDPSDRLVYVFRALDSFLLQNKSENIQQNIAERIAFTIASDGAERRRVVDVVKKAYGLRSDAVHHDASIEEADLMIEFLQFVYRFYLLLIGTHERYATRAELFTEVEGKKYGNVRD